MINGTVLAGVLLAGVLLAGCATHTGHRVSDADAMKARVESLESQVAALSQRLEEVSANQPVAQASAAAGGFRVEGRTSGAGKTRLTVRQVQKALVSAGYYKGTIDGRGGPQTQKAIKEFQQAQGLKADGIVGSATSEALAQYIDA